VLVAVIIWHRLGLVLALAILLLLGIVGVRAWLVRRRDGAVATPASTHSQTRREFIGACVAVTPSLFTVGLTGVAVAQLNQFRVRHFALSILALPRTLDGITIAHVSDMHVGAFTCGRVLLLSNRTPGLQTRRPRRGVTLLPLWRCGGSRQRFALRCYGGCGHFPCMNKPATSHLWCAMAMPTPLWIWHGFAFPSNRVAGSGAQFNSSVSIAPPHHVYGEINGCRRRCDGYTA